MSIRHQDTLEFTRRIQSALTPSEVCEELLRVTRPFGLESLIAGTVPLPGLRPAAASSHILFAGWPNRWLKRYVARNYVYIDPVVDHVQRQPGAAFSWSEAATEAAPSRNRVLMMGEAREHGLAAGFAVPFVTLEGEIATVSFGGAAMDLPPQAAGLIHLVGIFAMGRAFQLQARPRHAHERLSEREIEVLRWTAVGKTAWDVSAILGIAESTVKEHLARASGKLGTTNKVHTIAEAIRCGLID